MYKKLNHFHKKKLMLKKLNLQKKEKEDLKEKVKGSSEDLVNELYYIYK